MFNHFPGQEKRKKPAWQRPIKGGAVATGKGLFGIITEIGYAFVIMLVAFLISILLTSF